MSKKKILSERIKEVLKHRKMTQKELAVSIGADEGTMSRFLSSGNITLKTIERIEDALGINLILVI